MTDTDGAQAPFDDYDDLTAADIVDRLANATPDQVAAVKAYEAEHQARKTIADFEPSGGEDEPALDTTQAEPVEGDGRETFDHDAEEHVSGWDPPEGRPPLSEMAEELGAAYQNTATPRED